MKVPEKHLRMFCTHTVRLPRDTVYIIINVLLWLTENIFLPLENIRPRKDFPSAQTAPKCKCQKRETAKMVDTAT